MQHPKATVKLPFLIYRNEKEIEAEISEIRSKREENAQALREFIMMFCQWDGERKLGGITDYVLSMAFSGTFEEILIETWLVERSISTQHLNLTTARELYSIPDYSHLLKAAERLRCIDNIKQYYDASGTAIDPPEVTKEEKQNIIDSHSFYIRTEAKYRIYSTLLLLCEYANAINFELSNCSSISKGNLVTVVPLEYKRFIDAKKEGNSLKQYFFPKYTAFAE